MSAFRVGQKVVCVNVAGTGKGLEDDGSLKLGAVYVIRWIGIYAHPERRNDPNVCIKLEGVIRPSYENWPDYNDMPFRASRFRPLVTRKTDISCFEALLNTKSEKELVP